MSVAAGSPALSGAKISAPKAKSGRKVHTELLFEYSNGRDYDIAAVQATDASANSKLELDLEGQTKWERDLGSSFKFYAGMGGDKTLYVARLPKGYRLVVDLKQGTRHIVGHPGGMGRGFWYDSVAAFVPHLLWLAAPTPHDPARCSCMPCKKMLGKPKTKAAGAGAGAAKNPATKRKQSTGSASGGAKSGVASSAAATAVSAPASTAASTPPASTAPAGAGGGKGGGATAVTVPKPPSRSAAQQPAAALAPKAPSPAPVQEGVMFRVGEMVWFGTGSGVWRLGVIVDCRLDRPDMWIVAPLGHALLRQELNFKSAAQMKPFHAFSLPSIDNEELRGKTYAEVDWPSFVQRYAGEDAHRRQVIGLEASKMAARDANLSFSTFNRIGPPAADGRSLWGGVYLGPEMVRATAGDAVRVRKQVGELDGVPDVMEVRRIQDTEDRRLAFTGNVWRLQISGDESPVPVEQPQGADFHRQTDTYNEVFRPHGGRLDWVLVEQDALRLEADVFGRFYVTFDLLPDLRAKLAAESVPSLDDGTAYLNLRLRPDDVFYVGQRESRRATFGDAISGQLVLPAGVVES